MISPAMEPLPRDGAGQLIYPVDNGEPLSNDTEHLEWITFVKEGIDDWFGDRTDVFVAADLLWYPIEGRPDISKAPDVMVVLNHPAGHRSVYQQWKENNRPPQVVFEFISASNTAGEMIDKLEFYSEMGCEEFFIYDYRRGKFSAFLQQGGLGLKVVEPTKEQTWHSPLLGMTFGLNGKKLWIRRQDGNLVESRREVVNSRRELLNSQRELLESRREIAEHAARLAAKLRELGIDPDKV